MVKEQKSGRRQEIDKGRNKRVADDTIGEWQRDRKKVTADRI